MYKLSRQSMNDDFSDLYVIHVYKNMNAKFLHINYLPFSM